MSRVADAEQLGEEEEAHERPGKTEKDRDEEAARVVPRHEGLGDESGQQAEDDCSDHVSSLPAYSTGMPCRIVFSVTTRGSTNCSR